MVELRSIEKRYGDSVALRSVSLDIPENQVTALIGPSGCGKSTLLKMILGLVEPSGGAVKVDGQTVGPSTVQKLRRKIGYVVQDGGLFPHLTASQNISLMSEVLGHPKSVVDSRLAELCKLTHIEPNLLDRYPAELSGGQRQRVGLMRALALEPSLLLLDEPLGALDPLIRAGLQEDLKEIFTRGGQTVVFVTHDMSEAAYLADHIVLMREGAIVQQGTLQAFQEHPSEPFVSDFLNAQRQVGSLT